MAKSTPVQADVIAPRERNHQTTATGITATAVVASATCGRYRVARLVLYSLTLSTSLDCDARATRTAPQEPAEPPAAPPHIYAT